MIRIILALSLSGCTTLGLCRRTVEIVSVGGCDLAGNCGTMTTLGYAKFNKPVVGERRYIWRDCEATQ